MNLNTIVKNHHGYEIRKWNIELAKYKFCYREYDETMYDVIFANQDYQKTGDRTKLDKQLEYITKYLDTGDFVNEYQVPEWLSKRFDNEILLSYLDDDHCGDCTNFPASCVRCYIERLIGCETNVDNTPCNLEEALCDYQKIN